MALKTGKGRLKHDPSASNPSAYPTRLYHHVGPTGNTESCHLPHWRCVKLPSKYLCLYLQTNSILSLNQRTISFQWEEVNVETLGCTICWGKAMGVCLALKKTSIWSPLRLKCHCRNMNRKNVSTGRLGEDSGVLSARCNHCNHKLRADWVVWTRFSRKE